MLSKENKTTRDFDVEGLTWKYKPHTEAIINFHGSLILLKKYWSTYLYRKFLREGWRIWICSTIVLESLSHDH